MTDKLKPPVRPPMSKLARRAIEEARRLSGGHCVGCRVVKAIGRALGR